MSDSDSSYSENYSDDFDQAPATQPPTSQATPVPQQENHKQEPAAPATAAATTTAAEQQEHSPSSSRSSTPQGRGEKETRSSASTASPVSSAPSSRSGSPVPSRGASVHTHQEAAAAQPQPAEEAAVEAPAAAAAAAAAAPPPAGDAAQPGGGGAEADDPTEDELSEIKGLKRANEDLRQQLLMLNSQLDDALNQRGEKIVQVSRMQRVQNQDVEKLQKDIDRLRKANTRLNERLRQSDAAGRLAELQNVLNEKLREVEVLKEDNRSLENVHRNQAKKLASVEEVEARINAARDQHLEEVRQTKEHIQELKLQKESDDKLMKQQQAQINVLQMKIRAASQSKVNPKAIAELDKKVKEKVHVTETLRYQVGALTKSNEGDKKRLREQMKGSSAELKSLKEEAERLRSLVAHQDADPFPALTAHA